MADKGWINRSTLTDIADAIRAKAETSEVMRPDEMAALITAITTTPDGINEIESMTFAGTGTRTVSVPCSLSGNPVVAAVYAESGASNNTGSIQCLIVFGNYGVSSAIGSTGSNWTATFTSSGVLRITSGTSGSSAFIATTTYRCVVWR